jgi:Protein of unknown function (DUF2442)
MKIIKVKSAKHAGGHKLVIEFSDGTSQAVDFGPFLEASFHPETRKFLNPKKFKQFTVRDGDLMWGDFDLIFPVMDLYENKLDREVSKPRLSSGAR